MARLFFKDSWRRFRRKVAGKNLSRLIYCVVWMLRLTMRIDVIGKEIMPDFARRREGYVGIFWHARLLMMPFAYPGKRMNVLIGVHRDGQLIADVMNCFGFGLVRGSSSKGGREALREMKRLLENDNDIGITPDGPKGPPLVAKPGVAQIAILTGKAIIPVGFSSSRYACLTSWDKLRIPLPFSRGLFVIGEPIRAREGEDQETLRQRIELALIRATNEADELVVQPRKAYLRRGRTTT